MKITKLISGIAAGAMVLCAAGFSAFAEGNAAKIGDQTYPTIADAIAAASDGAVIEVMDGTYPENIDINKAVTLKGSEGAVFSGAISINAEGAALDGVNVKFEGTNSEPAGNLYGQIMINVNNVQLTNCDIYAYYTDGSTGIGGSFGVIHTNYNSGVIMDGCTIQTNTMGIFPAMTSGAIKNCTFKPLDEGDTRKSLAINGVSGNTEISGNTFYGMRILPSGPVSVTGNKFFDFAGSSFYMNYYSEEQPINISDNYWRENPDFNKILGTSGKLVIDTYYTDEAMGQKASVDEMTRVAFGGTLEGAEITDDGYTLTRDNESVTAWKGTIAEGASGNITVSASKDGETADTEITTGTIDSEFTFYVLVNAIPERVICSGMSIAE